MTGGGISDRISERSRQPHLSSPSLRSLHSPPLSHHRIAGYLDVVSTVSLPCTALNRVLASSQTALGSVSAGNIGRKCGSAGRRSKRRPEGGEGPGQDKGLLVYPAGASLTTSSNPSNGPPGASVTAFQGDCWLSLGRRRLVRPL
ncbi:hypothetical protein E2C01_002362 [Portunus trituberculatus]|uniref:Uncharacterized protein n=1 Tax=Portunus trituberculatus TaxID=210409 RepID=A0A5B7CQI4_PORTR|nr:hypothetical protein [Portunus trituberculatus]